jgi:hypothetical protein
MLTKYRGMMKKMIDKIQRPFLAQFLTRFLQDVFVLQPEQRTLVDESGGIITQIGRTTDQKVVAVARNALYNTIP